VITTDVCVVGGGPAGATAAIRLVMLGYRVCLVERDAAPRRRVGESLSPGVLVGLASLGLRDALLATPLLRPSSACIRWDSPAEVQRPGAGFLCDRGQLDPWLQGHARARGVDVLQPGQARGLTRRPAGLVVHVDTPGGPIDIQARFIVDACGREGLIPAVRRPTAPRTFAIHGHFAGVGLPGTTCVEARPDGWLWGAPLPGGLFSAMAFVEPGALRVGGRRGLTAALCDPLAASASLTACVPALLVAPPRALDASCRMDLAPIGVDYVKVGEACYTLDPLSATGVDKAIASALLAASAVHTILTHPERAASAIRFYEQRVRESVDQHIHWTAEAYARPQDLQDRPFWQQRATPWAPPSSAKEPSRPAHVGLSTPITLAPEVQIIDLPCLIGDLIAPHHALSHPGLTRPLGFLDGMAIAPLLDQVVRGAPLLATVELWARLVPAQRALALCGWLLRHGILIPMPTAP